MSPRCVVSVSVSGLRLPGRLLRTIIIVYVFFLNQLQACELNKTPDKEGRM